MSLNGAAFGGGNFTAIAQDIKVTGKQYPGLVLNPVATESSQVYVAAPREINGAIWNMQNADINAAGFFQVNPAVVSTAFVQLAGGGIATYSAPAGSAPGFTWTRLFYVDKFGVLQSPGFGQPAYFYANDYGAVGNNAVLDGPGIQAAIAAATANGGGTVLLGPSTYLTAQMLIINSANVNIMGMGQGTSVIQQSFVSSPTLFAVIELGTNAFSCTLSEFSIKCPGVGATGAVPGPTTLTVPSLGYGWGIMNFGASGSLFQNITVNGCYHGIGSIVFSSAKHLNCTLMMGGPQTSTQYGFYAQGVSGSAAVGTITITGTPTIGDTLSVELNDGQGNDFIVGPYSITAGDAGNTTKTALSFANFINDSQAVVGPNANWNPVVPSTNNIGLAIDYPTGSPVPTYTPSQTGGHTIVTPSTSTQVTGGTRNNNPSSFPWSLKNCSVPQAQLGGGASGIASTEAVHIDGGTESILIEGLGTTGCAYGIRFANANSGSDKMPALVGISQFSMDHTRIVSISMEGGVDANIHDGSIIANYGVGSPPANSAINISSTYGGGARIHDCKISNCDSGGITIGANGTTVENCRIVAVGKGTLSGINLSGTQVLNGIKIMGNKFGTPSLSVQGNGNMRYALDMVGTGGLTFTSTVQSFTFQGNDCQGRSGPINFGSILSNSLTAQGTSSFITICDNTGLNPIIGISDPVIPPAGSLPAAAVVNPYCCRAAIVLIPDGVHPITQFSIITLNGTISKTFSVTTGNVTIMVPANCAVLPVYAAGTASWFWFPID